MARITAESVHLLPDDAKVLGGSGFDDAVRIVPVKDDGGRVLGYYLPASAEQINDMLSPRQVDDPHSAQVRTAYGPNDGTIRLFDADQKEIARLEVTSGFGSTTKLVFAGPTSTSVGNALSLAYEVSQAEYLQQEDRYIEAEERRMIPVVYDLGSDETIFFEGMTPRGNEPFTTAAATILGALKSSDRHMSIKPSDVIILDGANGKLARLKDPNKPVPVDVNITASEEQEFVRAFFAARHNAEAERAAGEPDAQVQARIVKQTARAVQENAI